MPTIRLFECIVSCINQWDVWTIYIHSIVKKDICLSIYLSICLSVYLSVRLSIYLSIYPFAYQSQSLENSNVSDQLLLAFLIFHPFLHSFSSFFSKSRLSICNQISKQLAEVVDMCTLSTYAFLTQMSEINDEQSDV
jgi:hypothetical protein